MNRHTAAGRELAAPIGEEAIAVLAAIMRDKDAPPGVRAQCAIALADRAFGKPRQAVDLAMNKPVYVMSAEPLSPETWAAKYGDPGN